MANAPWFWMYIIAQRKTPALVWYHVPILHCWISKISFFSEEEWCHCWLGNRGTIRKIRQAWRRRSESQTPGIRQVFLDYTIHWLQNSQHQDQHCVYMYVEHGAPTVTAWLQLPPIVSGSNSILLYADIGYLPWHWKSATHNSTHVRGDTNWSERDLIKKHEII